MLRRRRKYDLAFTAGGPFPPPAPPPVITSIAPNLGDVAGGIPFLITGANFINVLSVTIGGIACTAIVVTPTTISCLTPALVAGVYDVVVTTATGVATDVGAFESFYPTSIAGLQIYDSELGIILAGSDITQWQDQNGITNLTGVFGTRPTYVANRFGISGSKHATVWDNSIAAQLSAVAEIPFGARSTFAVIKWGYANGSGTVTGTGEIIVGTGIPNDQGVHDFAVTAAGGLASLRTFNADAGINYTSPVDPVHFQYSGAGQIVGITHDGAGAGPLKFFLYNTQQGATQNDVYAAARNAWQFMGAGTGNFFGGEIGAVVQTESILSASDQAKIVTWMFGKWLARTYSYTVVNQNTSWFARDGAGFMTLDDGATLYLVGGWNGQGVGGQFPVFPGHVTNEVWKSTDLGITWTQILTDDSTDPLRFTARHVPGGWVVHNGYMYVIGSDVFNGPLNNVGTGAGTVDIWRSTDGQHWEHLPDGPWPVRTLHMCASYNGDLYMMGGQTDLNVPGSALNDVWVSSDNGFTWTQLANAPWPARGISGSQLPVKDGLLWMMGGGRYDNAHVADVFYSDVWTFDGSTWVMVAADGAAPWAQRTYHTQIVFENLLWIINGNVAPIPGANIADMWTSPDGINWLQQTIAPWRPSHADGMCVLSDRILFGPGNGNIGSPIDPGIGQIFQITRQGYVHP